MTNNHVQRQFPSSRSAKIPCRKGMIPPPTTPMVKTPDALVVYFPSLSIASVKIAGHMMEWKKPIPVNTQGLAAIMANINNAIAPMEAITNCFSEGTFLIKEPKKRPSRSNPQYKAAMCVALVANVPPNSDAYILILAPTATSMPT